MLLNRITPTEWEEIFSTYVIEEYNFTGVGYFLDLTCTTLKFEKETINQPSVQGKVGEIEVGFLLFVEGSSITIECHEYGDKGIPANIRKLQLLISLYN